MDGERFDAIAKSLSAMSRRRALRAIAGGALATALARAGLGSVEAQEATARRDGRVGDRCRRNNDCRGELRCCNRRCRDVQNDDRFCGSCSTRCGRREACVNGGCFRTCGNQRPNTCSLDACGTLCGCNPTTSRLGVCASTAQACRDARACEDDSDCREGQACIDSGCCGRDKRRICSRPCNFSADGSSVNEAQVRQLESGERSITDFTTLDTE